MSTMLQSDFSLSSSCSSPTVNGTVTVRLPARSVICLASKSNVALCLVQKSLPSIIGVELSSITCHSWWTTWLLSPS